MSDEERKDQNPEPREHREDRIEKRDERAERELKEATEHYRDAVKAIHGDDDPPDYPPDEDNR